MASHTSLITTDGRIVTFGWSVRDSGLAYINVDNPWRVTTDYGGTTIITQSGDIWFSGIDENLDSHCRCTPPWIMKRVPRAQAYLTNYVHFVVIGLDNEVWFKDRSSHDFRVMPELSPARFWAHNRQRIMVIGQDKILKCHRQSPEKQVITPMTNLSQRLTSQSPIVGVTYSDFEDYYWNESGEVLQATSSEKTGWTYYKRITNLPPIRLMSSSDYHVMALDDCGQVWVKSSRPCCQCSSIHESHFEDFTLIPNLPRIREVIAGDSHITLIDEEDGVWGFGNNQDNRAIPLITDDQGQPVCPSNANYARHYHEILVPQQIPQLRCHGSLLPKKLMIKSAASDEPNLSECI
jgi:alpha-tubulin suppressor-like RCC1 family protein